MQKNHLKLKYYTAWCTSSEDHNLSNTWSKNLKIYALKSIELG